MSSNIPIALVSKLKRELRLWLNLRRLTADWRRLAAQASHMGTVKCVRRLVIVPCDPWTLIGSKGDEAMIQAVVGRLAIQEDALSIAVITAASAADEAARDLGFAVLPVWRDPWRLDNVMDAIDAFQPDAIIVLGADVLDGYYSPETAVRLVAIADLAARRGVRAAILGFSFNRSPSRYLKSAFDSASTTLAINVRDPISLERFVSFSRAPARLVADAAFMLQPDQQSPSVKVVSNWVEGRRIAGDKVIAFNLHPMLIRVRDASPEQLRVLTDSATTALRQLIEHHPVSVLFLSHDYRGSDGDDACLSTLYHALQPAFPERLHYPTDKMSAAELKAVAGLMDGVVTGRMHLAIASLGMGVPVTALTYQDKFQGLFNHFGLPSSLLLSPDDAMNADKLLTMMIGFVSSLSKLRDQVAQALPRVCHASERNLSGFL